MIEGETSTEVVVLTVPTVVPTRLEDELYEVVEVDAVVETVLAVEAVLTVWIGGRTVEGIELTVSEV